MDYLEFIKRKMVQAPQFGFDVSIDEIHPILKPHQKAAVQWAVQGGRRALFEAYGLGKTIQQLEIVRLTLSRAPGRGLIVMPLGVRGEFMRDAAMLDIPVKFIRRTEEIDSDSGIYLTNYESVRDGKLNPLLFTVASLDEAAILKSFAGTLTFREFMKLFAGDEKTMNHRVLTGGVPYRFIATACPSPNQYVELLAYSAFLGIMEISQGKTRFFKRDSVHADRLTLYPHKADEFYMWLNTWSLWLQSPADLGFDATGYDLPEMEVNWREVRTDHSRAGVEKSGQMRMFNNAALGVTQASREKRNSLDIRVNEVKSIVENSEASEQIVIWCDLNDEQKALEKMLDSIGVNYSSLYGNQDIEKREQLMDQWRSKDTRVFLSKPTMYGAGVNLQQSHIMIFAGIGFKFHDVHQAIHRIHRFLQSHTCRIYFIYTQAERNIRKTLERKWAQHEEVTRNMTEIIKKYGLSLSGMAEHLTRAMGVERVEASGKYYRLVNNDCVLETRSMEGDSVGLILTSIPFSQQYEYSPNFCDMGHTDNNQHFWEQMDYLIPELFRVLQPGRLAAIHVKDRIVPGGMTGLGFQTVYPFHVDAINHFTAAGFGFMGMKTIVTDVVRENNQTYRLGWTEQCKDGSKMGFGMPEYLLLFRKPPSDTSNGYADLPVTKTKERYSRSRWQIDAHGFTRSSGDRLMNPEELKTMTHQDIFRMFRDYSLTQVYDFEHHVKIGETIDLQGRLPVTFMLLQPQSWSDEVWTDITRMLTLNNAQSAKGKENHVCPMQLDLADRAIHQWSNPGEVVYDPFSGIGTVPYRSVVLGRIGWGCELANNYWLDSATYCKAAEQERDMPTLFDMIEQEKQRRKAV